jgi:ferredoxin
MLRTIIHIDEEKCNGCGACATACHEGAIDMVDGKAKLVREHFCDGFGDCLPGCPTGAITFEKREAPEYDHQAVLAAQAQKAAAAPQHTCPGAQMRAIRSIEPEQPQAGAPIHAVAATLRPQLQNWPVQIKLVPIQAPYFDGAKLLIAADCTAYAYANFHGEFMRGKVTLIGCPKLDAIDYSEKLTQILRNNNITGVTIVKMEVPCCGGLEAAVKKALQASGKFLPWQVVTIGISGEIME